MQSINTCAVDNYHQLHLAGSMVGFMEDNNHLKITLIRINHQPEIYPITSAPLGAWNLPVWLSGWELSNHLLHDNK
jgi:hypothetical protein